MILGAGCVAAAPQTRSPSQPPTSSEPIAASELEEQNGWRPTPDAEFRHSAPGPGAERPWEAPVPESSKLSNGMRLLLVQRPHLPIVVVHLVAPRGAEMQPRSGVGSFLGAMLEQGTTSRSALEISEAFLDIGAEHSAWVDWDSTNVEIKVLPSQLRQGIEIIADIIKNPSFPTDEIERLMSRTVASIRQQMDNPRTIMNNTIARTLFAGSPYGDSLRGTEESLANVSQSELKALHRKLVLPQEMAVVVVGDTTASEVAPIIEKAFGNWKVGSVPVKQFSSKPPRSRKISVVDRKGSTQSTVALASVGISRSSTRFGSALIANSIFGGMFSSRLNMNLRERHGYTYGARSHFDMRHNAGPFVASAAVDTPNTGAALKEMLDELERFCSGPPSSDEMTLSLGQEVRSLPGLFESGEETARRIALLVAHRLSMNEYRSRPALLNGVTPADVHSVATELFDPHRMQIVVVGDFDAIRSQLEELRFGPIEVVDAHSSKVLQVFQSSDSPRTFSCK